MMSSYASLSSHLKISSSHHFQRAEMPEVLVIQRLPIQWQFGFLAAERTLSDVLVFEKERQCLATLKSKRNGTYLKGTWQLHLFHKCSSRQKETAKRLVGIAATELITCTWSSFMECPCFCPIYHHVQTFSHPGPKNWGQFRPKKLVHQRIWTSGASSAIQSRKPESMHWSLAR